jgi:anion-transporting  ArsA/GET3 family ATPase
LVRWLTMPARSRVLTLASKPFYQVADRILGSAFLGDIVEFFSLIQTMEAGFLERARAVSALFADRRTTFVVVSTLEATPIREAHYFVDALAERKLHLGAVVLNKALPAELAGAPVTEAVAALGARAGSLAAELVAGRDAPAAVVTTVLEAVADNARNLQAAARRERAQRDELAAAAAVTRTVPILSESIGDLAGLAGLGRWLFD